MNKVPSAAALKELELLDAEVRALAELVRASSSPRAWAAVILLAQVVTLALVLVFVRATGGPK